MPLPLLPQATLDLTGLDRETVLPRVQRLFNQANPGWVDFTPNYPENLLLEGLVTVLDTYRAVLENRARQLSWATVTDRLAAIRLGRMSGFQLTGGSASTVTLVFTSPSAAITAKEVPIPAGTRVRTNDPISSKRYVTTAAVTKTAGLASISVSAENAEEIVESFTVVQDPNQEFILDRSPYIQDSAVVSDSNGAFEIVSSFLDLTSGGLPITAGSRVCVLLIDDQSRLIVRFGNGVTGALPTGSVGITYKVGGGADGAVAALAAWMVEDTLLDSGGGPVTLNVSNPAAATQGMDAMSVAEARVLGPLSMRTINRCVTCEDFEYVAKLVPGIARSAMITSDFDDTVLENQGVLYLVGFGTRLASGCYAPDTNTLSASKISALEALIAPTGLYPALMGFTITVTQADFKTVSVSARIQLASGYSEADVRENIEEALGDFFAVALEDKTPNPEVDFGFRMLGGDGQPDYMLKWSDVFSAIVQAPGVAMIDTAWNGLTLNGARNSVSLNPHEFPVLGSVQLFNLATGLDF